MRMGVENQRLLLLMVLFVLVLLAFPAEARKLGSVGGFFNHLPYYFGGRGYKRAHPVRPPPSL
ncbi:hypothetical protein I3760_08G073300 [Carya illinoinensis]|nr:hypothetical protein I3760_08G073300 [Carya illinoinensis]